MLRMVLAAEFCHRCCGKPSWLNQAIVISYIYSVSKVTKTFDSCPHGMYIPARRSVTTSDVQHN